MYFPSIDNLLFSHLWANLGFDGMLLLLSTNPYIIPLFNLNLCVGYLLPSFDNIYSKSLSTINTETFLQSNNDTRYFLSVLHYL